ncbi:hypothetical protein NCS52_00885100 [Fusarium sp. LHS14.1]|nr:hypothetical protein NCS52_00885100 [Fusarium sp. LHS14.1]
MNPVWDWTNFSAFDGTLNRQTLFAVENPADTTQVARLKRQAQTFYDWLSVIRDDARLTPVFGASREMAELVLDHFFPNGGTALRVSDHTQGFDPTRLAIPLSLPLGNTGIHVNVIDGPSALAYLFSIAEPPEGQEMTLDKYYLPMQILLSRAIYLAFMGSITTDPFVYDLDSVPYMTCLMYLDDPQPTAVPQYVFGSTHTPGLATDADENALYNPRMLLLDEYRKGQMNAALVNMDLGELPFGLSPHEVECFATRLYKDTFRRQAVKQAAQVALGVLGPVFRTQRAAQNPPPVIPQGVDQDPIAYDQPWALTHYKQPMLDLLISAIYQVYALSTPMTAETLFPMFRPFLRLWLTPHVRTVPPPPGQPFELTIDNPIQSAVLDAALDTAVQTFWGATANTYIGRLQAIHTEIKNQPRTRRYGRCAETYPFAAMTYPFWNGKQLDDQARIQGVSVDVRKVGQVNFSQNFTDVAFGDGDPGNCTGLYRKPCEICQTAFPKLRMDLAHYEIPVVAIPHAVGVA